MYKITHIIEIKPYQIAARFNSGKITKIDFTPLVEIFPVLKDPAVFVKAKIDNYPTISWDGLAFIRELDGTVTSCSLDFSPETLYPLSTLQNN